MSHLFKTLSSFVIGFLPRNKCLLISWLQSPSAVILESRKLKSVNAYTFTPFYLPWSDGTRCHDLSFLKVKFQASFFTPLSLSSRGSLVTLHFLPWEWYHLHIWGFPGGSAGKESACNAGDLGSIPGLQRSPGEGNSYLLQSSCLESSMDRTDWDCKESAMTQWLLLHFTSLSFYLLPHESVKESFTPHLVICFVWDYIASNL